MRAGEFPNGARVLRAKIDMASPNINLRDPVLYRIVHASHPRTGDAWCIYPTYDFAHGQSDAIEGVTHSICTLEFDVHRPLYDWLIEHLPVPSVPHQYEFARLNLTHTVLSKRVLMRLVDEGHVRGWDDPRMPTISGLRRRGFPAEGIRDFAAMIGVARTDSVIEFGQLEYAVRGVLNRTAQRRFGVLDPLKVVITNCPEGRVETMEVVNNPEDPAAGTRRVEFSRELWIERDDFMEEPPRSSSGSRPGARFGCGTPTSSPAQEMIKDGAGSVVELRCTYDPATRGGDAPDGRRPKATLHWVSASRAVPAEVRLYDHLFSRPDPGAEATCSPTSTRSPRRSSTGASWSRPWRPLPRRDGPVRAPGLLHAGHGLASRRAGVQPDAYPEGHLGEAPGQGIAPTGPAVGPATGRRYGRPRGGRRIDDSPGTQTRRGGQLRTPVHSGGRVAPPRTRDRCGSPRVGSGPSLASGQG